MGWAQMAICWEGRPETRQALMARRLRSGVPRRRGWCGAVVLPGRQSPGRERGKGGPGGDRNLWPAVPTPHRCGGAGVESQGSEQEAGGQLAPPWRGPMSRQAPLPSPQPAQGGEW